MSTRQNREEQTRAAVILAAGKGTRMKSDLPKVAVPLKGKPLLLHVIDSLRRAGVTRLILVVGYKKEDVIALIPEYSDLQVEFVEQKEQLGTAHALLCTADALKNYSGPLMVACGDMPLIRAETFRSLFEEHSEKGNRATVLSAVLENPHGYGRLVRDSSGDLLGIVEEKDATDEIRSIKETNTGTYLFDAPQVFEALNRVGSENAQKEYYLPDVISIFQKDGESVGSLIIDDPDEAIGCNSKEDLLTLETKLVEMQS